MLAESLAEQKAMVHGTSPNSFRQILRSSGFELEAEKIRHQIKTTGMCSKSQLDYLFAYAEHEAS